MGGIRAGPALAGVLYVLLVGSAALALWVREFPGFLPASLERAAPYVFAAFVACFAVYRLALVRARKYSAFKAFFQIGAAALFFMLLLPGAKRSYQAEGDALTELMGDPNPQVRALAVEVARHRPEPAKYGSLLVKALKDPDHQVRAEAHRTLVEITGTDLGAPSDEAALEAWGARYP